MDSWPWGTEVEGVVMMAPPGDAPKDHQQEGAWGSVCHGKSWSHFEARVVYVQFSEGIGESLWWISIKKFDSEV